MRLQRSINYLAIDDFFGTLFDEMRLRMPFPEKFGGEWLISDSVDKRRFLELFLSIHDLSNNKLCATCGKYGHQQ
jgi:hypothetical protein